MSKTFTSRPSVTSRGRGSTRGQTNQSTRGGAGRGSNPTTTNVRGRVFGLSSQPASRPRGRGSVRQTTRGAMYSSGARSRGARTGMYQPRPGEMGEPPEEEGAVGPDPQSQEQRMSYKGGYSVLSPNEKKRQQISEQARRETEEYERHKAESKPKHVSYVGTVGGGQMSEAEARRQLVQQHSSSKYNRLEQQRVRREERKREEESVYERKKLDARKMTEANERRALREEDKKRDEMERIKNTFLDNFEKRGAAAAAKSGASSSTPQNPANRPSISHDPEPRPSPSNQRPSMSHDQNPRRYPANERRDTEQSHQAELDHGASLTEEMNSDLQTLHSMFPQYSVSNIAEIYNQNHSLEITAEILSDS